MPSRAFIGSNFESDLISMIFVLQIGGNAIHIRNELVHGSTIPGNTFNNPELVRGGDFTIDNMEVCSFYIEGLLVTPLIQICKLCN